MTSTDTTLSALFASCAQFPDDDTPRLALADCLEERGGVVACKRCSGTGNPGMPSGYDYPGIPYQICPTCSGSGHVPDALAAQAQYIRAAVELEREDLSVWRDAGNSDLCWACWIIATGKEQDHAKAVKEFGCQCTGRIVALHRLASSLLAAHGREWVHPKCERCGGSGHNGRRKADGWGLRKCGVCDGNKISGPLARVPFADIGWSRGLPVSVKAPLADWGREIELPSRSRRGATVTAMPNEDRRRWLPSPWAFDLVRAWPVTRCVVSDREPSELRQGMRGDGMDWFDWFPPGGLDDEINPPDAPWRLPESLWRKVAGKHARDAVCTGSKTRQEAIDKLATVLGTLTRAAAWPTA